MEKTQNQSEAPVSNVKSISLFAEIGWRTCLLLSIINEAGWKAQWSAKERSRKKVKDRNSGKGLYNKRRKRKQFSSIPTNSACRTEAHRSRSVDHSTHLSSLGVTTADVGKGRMKQRWVSHTHHVRTLLLLTTLLLAHTHTYNHVSVKCW